jgi:hypothetical protein
MWQSDVVRLGPPIGDKERQVPVDWKPALAVLSETKMPRGYVLGRLRRAEVPDLVDRLRAWYPDIVVGAESCHLRPEFYYEQTALAESEQDRQILPVVAKQGDVVVAMITFEMNRLSLTITSRMGAVAPEHRGSGLALLGPRLLESIGRAIGAELAYYFATLKSAHQQVLAERLRYRIVGIVPAFDRDMVRPGEVKRVYEAIYAKVLVNDQDVAVPEQGVLTARTRAVWNAVFGVPTEPGSSLVSASEDREE